MRSTRLTPGAALMAANGMECRASGAPNGLAGPLLRVAAVIRLQVLALDYDSTLAWHDHLTAPTVAARALLRASLTGLVAVLVEP